MYIFGQAVQERGISQVVMSRARTRTLLIARVHAAAQSRQHLVRLRVDGVDATGVDLGACVQRRAGNLHINTTNTRCDDVIHLCVLPIFTVIQL